MRHLVLGQCKFDGLLLLGFLLPLLLGRLGLLLALGVLGFGAARTAGSINLNN
jgi:hypothetical protein